MRSQWLTTEETEAANKKRTKQRRSIKYCRSMGIIFATIPVEEPLREKNKIVWSECLEERTQFLGATVLVNTRGENFQSVSSHRREVWSGHEVIDHKSS